VLVIITELTKVFAAPGAALADEYRADGMLAAGATPERWRGRKARPAGGTGENPH